MNTCRPIKKNIPSAKNAATAIKTIIINPSNMNPFVPKFDHKASVAP
jgi:hypothetical protein